jgi:hypothetical protein
VLAKDTQETKYPVRRKIWELGKTELMVVNLSQVVAGCKQHVCAVLWFGKDAMNNALVRSQTDARWTKGMHMLHVYVEIFLRESWV